MARATRADLALEVEALRKALDQARAKSAALETKLTEAHEQQTASAEILRAISQAQSDVHPVFEAIADAAMRLRGARSASVFRYQDGLLHLAAAPGGPPGSGEVWMEQLRTPRQPTDDYPPGRAVLTHAVHA